MADAASTSDENPAHELAIDAATLEPEIDPESGIDVSLIRMNLAMSLEERWRANDGALNFITELRQAVARHYEPSE